MGHGSLCLQNGYQRSIAIALAREIHYYSMLDFPRLAGTDIWVAMSPTCRVAELNKCGRLDLNSELSGMVADPVHRLVDVIPTPLEGQALSPLLCDILPHREPDIRDVGAGVHPGGSRVRRHCFIGEVKAFDARGRVEIQRADTEDRLTLIAWTGTVPADELVGYFLLRRA